MEDKNFRIMKTNEFGDATFYRASCSCSDERCDLTLELEIVKEFEMINLNIYENLRYASYWKTDNWFVDKWYRIKGAVKLLFIGHLDVENTFVFEGEKQIKDFLYNLNNGMKELKKELQKGKTNEKN